MFLLILVSVCGILFARYRKRLRNYLRDQDLVVPTAFDLGSGKNILWNVPVGSQSYGGPVVADDKVFVGTNNEAGYLDAFPSSIDLGALICFDARNGKFLWQASTEKLPTGRVHDWPTIGICSSPRVERDRLWYVTNRCELVCLDTEGFLDDEDDGVADISKDVSEPDTVWKLDMRGQLNVSPHNVSSSSPCIGGDMVFVVTGNGVDANHADVDSAQAPSFIAVDKRSGRLRWSDNSPGENILHGQWGSPTYAVINGQAQVIFPGGDGWLYGFDPKGNGKGRGKLLWKFDCNPKVSAWVLGGRGTRNNLLTTPTVSGNHVLMAVGQDPEHGEGPGHVWCIDATKRGDISAEIVTENVGNDVRHSRLQAANKDAGHIVNANPNSGLVWHFEWTDNNGDGQRDFEEEMHRSLSQVIVKDDQAFVTDLAGVVHCLDVNTGTQRWAYDLMSCCWSTPVVGASHVFVGSEDGNVVVLNRDGTPANKLGTPLVSESFAGTSVYATPRIHSNVLYVLTKNRLFAVGVPSND